MKIGRHDFIGVDAYEASERASKHMMPGVLATLLVFSLTILGGNMLHSEPDGFAYTMNRRFREYMSLGASLYPGRQKSFKNWGGRLSYMY